MQEKYSLCSFFLFSISISVIPKLRRRNIGCALHVQSILLSFQVILGLQLLLAVCLVLLISDKVID